MSFLPILQEKGTNTKIWSPFPWMWVGNGGPAILTSCDRGFGVPSSFPGDWSRVLFYQVCCVG